MVNWPLITTDTTIDELQSIHRQIWDYAIEHGYKPVTPYINGCVACDHAFRIRKTTKESACPNCPIIWPDGRTCRDPGSLFNLWDNSDWLEAERYARLIRDVEWRDQ